MSWNEIRCYNVALFCSASHQRIGGVMYDGEKIYNAAVQEVTPVVE
jgi:hypothetical protein